MASTIRGNDNFDSETGVAGFVWAHIQQTGTQTLRDSNGVSSITDIQAGRTRTTFSNNYANTYYSFTAGQSNTASGSNQISVHAPSVSGSPTEMTTSTVLTACGADRVVHALQFMGDPS